LLLDDDDQSTAQVMGCYGSTVSTVMRVLEDDMLTSDVLDLIISASVHHRHHL
jgi:hypothetical protein